MTETAALEVGQRVTATEYDESTRAPRHDGQCYPATVTALEGIYVQVRYDSEALNSGRPDSYYAESGWRAWDGCLRWRLHPEGSQS